MTTRRHWSYSSINQYLRCPLQFFFQRVLGLPYRTTTSGLVLGSAVHVALAEYHRGLQRNEIVGANGLLKILHDTWTERESTEEIIYRDGDSRDDSLAQGVNLIELYLKEPPPTGIVAVEQEIIAPLINSRGEYLETPLVAVTDLLVTEEDHLKVQEFKTSGRAYGESEVESSLQPTCYVHAVNEVYGQQAKVEYTVLVKTRTPKVQRLTTSRYADDFGRLGDLVETIEKAVQLGIFYPVESPMNCATCPYRQQCRDWGRRSEPAQKAFGTQLPVEAMACSAN